MKMHFFHVTVWGVCLEGRNVLHLSETLEKGRHFQTSKRHGPAIEYGSCSPDLFPPNYWFWSVALSEVRRCAPTTLEQLIGVVEGLAAAMDSG